MDNYLQHFFPKHNRPMSEHAGIPAKNMTIGTGCGKTFGKAFLGQIYNLWGFAIMHPSLHTTVQRQCDHSKCSKSILKKKSSSCTVAVHFLQCLEWIAMFSLHVQNFKIRPSSTLKVHRPDLLIHMAGFLVFHMYYRRFLSTYLKHSIWINLFDQPPISCKKRNLTWYF